MYKIVKFKQSNKFIAYCNVSPMQFGYKFIFSNLDDLIQAFMAGRFRVDQEDKFDYFEQEIVCKFNKKDQLKYLFPEYFI